MEILVDNAIIIRDPSPDMQKWARTELVLSNPDYIKKLRMGKWVGSTPSEIWLFESLSDGSMVLPFGCLQELWKRYRMQAVWKPRKWPQERREYGSRITLYPYQEKAASEALRARNGILVMPCGSGKTQTGLEIISRIGGRALWLTHTQDLLNQSLERAKSVLDIGGKWGKITGGRVNIGTHITFATVQTLCKVDLEKYKDQWDIIICDECQHCCGSPTRVTQFYKVMSRLSARYKFGLTATPHRNDGLDRSMTALLGDIICEVSKAEVAGTTCPVAIRQMPTGWIPDYDAVLMADGAINYAALVNSMTQDAERFEVVQKQIEECVQAGPTMVLASRVEYLQRLADALGEGALCLSGAGNGKAAKQVRENALTDLDQGRLKCILATYALAKEGLDVPHLKYLILATPEKDETTVIQSVGRVGRKAEGKDVGTVFDMVDSFGMYKGWAKKRAALYRKHDYEII